jgi:hypothetical protein
MIDTIALSKLHHDEHFQFQTEIRDLINGSDPIKAIIQEAFNSHHTLYVQEDGCIKKVLKSETTEKRLVADKERDTTFRGFSGSIKAALNHSDPKVKESAYRLDILLKRYGNLARKPYQEETAGIYNLIGDLRDKYAADIEILKLEDWVNELESKNIAFENLVKARFTELEQATELKMQDVRKKIDKVYLDIVEQIKARILLENNPIYETFARQLNARISVYNNLLAQRKGRLDAKRSRKQRDDE